MTPFPYRGVSHELLTLECHVNDTRYSVIWAELLRYNIQLLYVGVYVTESERELKQA